MNIHRLPNELMLMLFKMIDLSDLIANCKPVCKRWKLLIEFHMKFAELVLTLNAGELISNHWYYTHRTVSRSSICYWPVDDLSFFSGPSFRLHFGNLKRLKISTNSLTADLQQLNHLTALEHLDLDGALNLNRTVTLCLPDLQILKLFLIFNPFMQLKIDAIRLQVLCCNQLEFIHIVWPSSIRHLELAAQEMVRLNRFKNLNTLVLVNTRKHLAATICSAPATLKQLHLNNVALGKIGDLLSSLERKLTNVRVWLNGVELIKQQPLDEHLSNYQLYRSRLTNLCTSLPGHLEMLNFNKLSAAFESKIPNEFLARLSNIQSVACGQLEDRKMFVEFLRSCKSLAELKLTCVQFPSSGANQLPDLFDELPKIVGTTLLKLQLFDDAQIRLNFDFLLMFDLLTAFETNQRLPMQSAWTVIERSKSLRSLVFENNRSEFRIRRTGRTRFELDYLELDYLNGEAGDGRNSWFGVSFDKLVEICKVLENKRIVWSFGVKF